MSPIPEHLPSSISRAIQHVLTALRKQKNNPITAVMLYGSYARGDFVVDRSNINLLIVATDYPLEWLQRIGPLQARWRKDGVVAPLMLTEQELQDSLGLFPLEFLEMKDQSVLLEGQDPFLACHLNLAHLLVQCEQEIRGNLLRVRQRFVEGWGRPEAIQTLLPISLVALLPCIRGLFHLLNHSPDGTTQTVLEQVEPVLNVKNEVLLEVLSMKRGVSTPGRIELPRLFERYLETLKNLVNRIQDLKRSEHL
ncbi:MAG: hypothetical protein GKS05_11980 [Nitrospirales bacterium]|nr:hypothetical protein [Nitrospirales bacterium]